jgi:hypothetical protein
MSALVTPRAVREAKVKPVPWTAVRSPVIDISVNV